MHAAGETFLQSTQRVRTQRERIGKATAAEVMMMKWMQIELIRPFFYNKLTGPCFVW
jgi:hypothetical protein